MRKPTDTTSWPVIWRVVAPGAGSHDRDMIYVETTDEEEALKEYRMIRRAKHPVRLERVQCGPLPVGFKRDLESMRSCNAQEPGTKLRSIPGAWTQA